ncbi:hypothetical protein Q5P01_006403 [Channa striata]|uniref:Uncharacterized protein n=1 Tax=Channa striata TaxID=64152 RepID=A0AA88SWZ2_CHASR|nr:hypothetical protein Q5P01_006403 [Channa striata]
MWRNKRDLYPPSESPAQVPGCNQPITPQLVSSLLSQNVYGVQFVPVYVSHCNECPGCTLRDIFSLNVSFAD